MQLAPGQRPLVVALGMRRCRVKAGTAWPSGFHGSNEGWKPTWQEMGGYGEKLLRKDLKGDEDLDPSFPSSYFFSLT